MSKVLKAFFVIVQLILPFCAYTQATYINYQSNTVYQPLANAIVITEDFAQTRYTIDLNSDFNVFMKSFPCFGIRGLNVEVGFGALTGTNSSNDTLFSVDGFFSNGLISRNSSSAIKYVKDTISSPGEIIVKVQWENMTIRGGNPTTDSVNFQIWLYQSGQVEIHFGPTYIGSAPSSVYLPGNNGPAVGLFLSSPSLSMYESIFLTGSPGNPGTNRMDAFVGLNDEPQSGQVYIFKYSSTVGFDKFQSQSWEMKVYSMTQGRKILIESNDLAEGLVHYQLRNITGAIVQEGSLHLTEKYCTAEFMEVPHGIYTIQLTREEKSAFYKISL